MLDWFPDTVFGANNGGAMEEAGKLRFISKRQRLETQSESSTETNKQNFSSSNARENSESDESDSGSK